jgi:hypothetical protein
MGTKDFEKMWDETKNRIYNLSKEAVDLIKKGEKEVSKASNKAKINFETTLLQLKKEQLFHLIGKEYYKSSGCCKTVIPSVDKLVGQVGELDSQIKANNKLLRKKVK